MAFSSSQQAALTTVVGVDRVQWNAPLSARTTYRIGGPADAVVTLLDVGELIRILAWCQSERVRWKVFGRGSNILAADEGFRGLVIVLGGEFKYIVRQSPESDEEATIRVGGGAGLPGLAEWSCREELAGLEFASGIPGTVAGAVMMNAGAWGEDIGGLVEAVELIGVDGTTAIPAAQLEFSYRQCVTTRETYPDRVIGFVRLRLQHRESALIRARIAELAARRRIGQPSGLPSGGCVFKNPPGVSAGQLIERAGLKGMRIGDAEVSGKHGNFLVNRGSARAEEMLALIETVQDRVRQETGIMLQREVEYLPVE